MFSIIAAIGKNRELGLRGDLCFHLKEDLRYFKDTTMGHTVLMGRKTWESLPKKLPGRKNLVISRNPVEGADETITDLPAYIEQNANTDEEIFVIGGGMAYWEMMKHVKRLYLTEIDAKTEADTFFPSFNPEEWNKKIVKEGAEDGLKFVFAVYDRK